MVKEWDLMNSVREFNRIYFWQNLSQDISIAQPCASCWLHTKTKCSQLMGHKHRKPSVWWSRTVNLLSTHEPCDGVELTDDFVFVHTSCLAYARPYYWKQLNISLWLYRYFVQPFHLTSLHIHWLCVFMFVLTENKTHNETARSDILWSEVMKEVRSL